MDTTAADRKPERNYYSLPPWYENPWIELLRAINRGDFYKISNSFNVIADQLTEEQIMDIQEVQDSLLIPLRPTAGGVGSIYMAQLSQLAPAQTKPGELPQLAGKVSTKIRR